jgi:hypothetical protein
MPTKSGGAFVLYWIFVAGAGMLGISIALNSLSDHATCTAAYVAAAAVIGFALASIQTLGQISWLAWVGLFGILSAIFTLTVAAPRRSIRERLPHCQRLRLVRIDLGLLLSRFCICRHSRSKLSLIKSDRSQC